jgi:uncharacterized NAD-dependent epimerase/dehydratase family protein
MVLVHHAGRSRHRADPAAPIPPLRELRAAYEQMAALLHSARVVGVALNSFGQDERTAQSEARRIAQELRVPVRDLVRDGAGQLLVAVLEACAPPLRSGAEPA